MSLSKPKEQNINPAKKWIECKGGETSWFDKTIDNGKDKQGNELKKGADVPIDLMKKGFIIVDDDLFTIKGYSKKYEAGVYSNMARQTNVGEAILTVRVFDKMKTVVAKGTYQKVKEACQALNTAGYAKVMYIWVGDELYGLTLTGNARSAWFDSEVNKYPEKCGTHYVRIKEWVHKETKDKKGKVLMSWEEPVFVFGGTIDPEELAAATSCDAEILQPYLAKYLAGKLQNPSETAHQGSTESRQKPDEPVNTDNWRAIPIPNRNAVLGSLELDELQVIKGDLEEINDTGAFYDMVCRGIHDWDFAKKNWRKWETTNRVTKETTLLGDWGLSEMQSMLAMIDEKQPHHPLRQPLAAGIHEASTRDRHDDDDDSDDIPF